VHVGQEDLPPAAARVVVGPAALVGVSTHNREQLRQALRQDVHYIGVGPIFPSRTKDFAELAGLEYVRHAAAAPIPAFCIGGVTPQNVHRIVEAGGRRIAVGRAISESNEPSRVVRHFLSELGRL
jgi:thiamine-phosphate pyrophosphorylase